MIEAVAIAALAVVALCSVLMVGMALALLHASVRTFQHERRISELETDGKQTRKDLDELDLVVDRTLDAANVSRNGVLREPVEKI